MSKDARQELEDIIKGITQDSKSASTMKFLLFMEDYPEHNVKHDLGVSDCILTFFLSTFLGSLGFLIWCNFTIIGFMFYYVAACAILLETLHVMFDRQWNWLFSSAQE